MRKRLRDAAPRKIRCAIYTRKSTEEGLEQEFNSLDAQREACAAYIVSQRHEGWIALPDIYDDGGYSGGNMDRPGLKALMAEVAAKRVDVIVVYKVDRLTRSLSDFARIVDVLDDAGASFVSVTQSFSTTSSMGRLTLNVLLSFAQFEREVTGERIRDKIAASKKKGMWMGGPVPLGYRLEERKLLIEPAEAETIRMIFSRFLQLGSGRLLVAELDRLRIRSKPRSNRHGRAYGEQPISRGALYAMLRSRLYVGEVVHKGQSYPGQHEAIIANDIFERVQQQLDAATVERRHRTNAEQPSLLAGLLVDGLGRRMSPSHAVRSGKRYRYYVSQQDGDVASATSAWRISAGEIEALVLAEVPQALRNMASRHIAAGDPSGDEIAQVEDRLQRVIASLETPAPSRAALLQIVERIDVGEGELAVTIKCGQLQDNDEETIVVTAPLACVRRGQGIRIVVPPKAQGERARNPALLKLVAQAFAAREEMERGGSFDEVAARLGCGTENLADMIRTSFLSPDIIAAIVEGHQPASLTRRQLVSTPRVPLGWSAQETMFGFC
jgi:site-specific DNA recombinase